MRIVWKGWPAYGIYVPRSGVDIWRGVAEPGVGSCTDLVVVVVVLATDAEPLIAAMLSSQVSTRL